MQSKILRQLLPASRSTARLAEFTFTGRTGPALLLTVFAAGYFLLFGFDHTLRILLQLCTAFIVAYLLLALLGRIAGQNAPWFLVLPTAVIGSAFGGFASAAIAVAPNWPMLTSWENISSNWKFGAAFSIFFVALSLATTLVRKRENTEHETRQRMLEARLQMLAARIEPHFLRNTLANLRYLVNSDTSTANEMLNHLSRFLDGALQRSRDISSTLGQEIEIVESYLSIMKIRLGEKLRFSIEVPEQLSTRRFPALLLQTLVENAIRHGIEPLDRNGEVAIRARKVNGHIQLTIADNGAGYDPEQTIGDGIGLSNVRERLDAFFGERARLHIESQPEKGALATVRFPDED